MVSFSLIGCHVWHSKTSRQWCLLDLHTEWRGWCQLYGLNISGHQLFEPNFELVYLIIYGRDNRKISYPSEGRWSAPCLQMSAHIFPLLRPSQLKMSCDGLRASSMISLSPWLHNCIKPSGATWCDHFLRSGGSYLAMSPSNCNSWAGRLSPWMWDLLRVHVAGRGRITMRGGLSDLLLNLWLFSRSEPGNRLRWWDYHPFQ